MEWYTFILANNFVNSLCVCVPELKPECSKNRYKMDENCLSVSSFFKNILAYGFFCSYFLKFSRFFFDTSLRRSTVFVLKQTSYCFDAMRLQYYLARSACVSIEHGQTIVHTMTIKYKHQIYTLYCIWHLWDSFSFCFFYSRHTTQMSRQRRKRV